ncbi:MAG: ExbD/TolR family protein [Chitinophagaceae bacterium]
MASLDTGGGDSGHKKGPGVKKAKKNSTLVDMTPLVDLGFLLITFFIFTSTMSTPSTLALNMPKEEKDEEKMNQAKASGALTMILASDNQVYYYEGELAPDASNFQSTNFKEARNVIINRKKQVMASHQHNSQCEEIRAKNNGDPKSCLDRDLVVVIKPTAEATYKNTVDMLDEMTINVVKRFAVVDVLPVEEELIKRTQAAGAAQ